MLFVKHSAFGNKSRLVGLKSGWFVQVEQHVYP